MPDATLGVYHAFMHFLALPVLLLAVAVILAALHEFYRK